MAPKIFLSIKIDRFLFTKYMADDDFSEPPRRADSKNPIFIFWVWVTSEAQGSVSVGFWGSRQLSPFLGGGVSQGALSTPPAQLQARLPLGGGRCRGSSFLSAFLATPHHTYPHHTTPPVWCDVVWCSVLWCGVVCRRRCYQRAKGRDVYPRVQVNGLGCVCCVRARSLWSSLTRQCILH